MHVINTQSPSPHRRGSTGSFAHQSRSSEETRLTTTDVVHDTGGQLLHRDRRSEHQGSGPSAAWPVTRMQEEEIQQAQNTYDPYYANAPGIPCSICSAQPNIAIFTGRDGLHLQPSGHGNESIIKPLLSGPGESKTCRKKSDLAAIGQAVLDVCIAATSLYFLGFAIAVSAHKGEPAASSFADSLLKAARFVSSFPSALRRTNCNQSVSGSHYLAYHVRCRCWTILDRLHSLAAGTQGFTRDCGVPHG